MNPGSIPFEFSSHDVMEAMKVTPNSSPWLNIFALCSNKVESYLILKGGGIP